MSGRCQILHIISQLPHERISRPAEVVNESVLLRVPVLIHEALDAVADGARVVLHSELLLPFPPRPFHEGLVLAKLALYVCEVSAV